MEDYNRMQWRVGTKVRRTIYAVIPGKDHEDHILLGLMDTPQLATEVVGSHNRMLNTATFAQKEQLLKDLEKTAELWNVEDGLEPAIIQAVGEGPRARKVYEAVGAWVDILGDETDMPKAFQHAINQIRTS